MEDVGFFSDEEPSFKARQLFFQQKLDTVDHPSHLYLFYIMWYTIGNKKKGHQRVDGVRLISKVIK